LSITDICDVTIKYSLTVRFSDVKKTKNFRFFNFHPGIVQEKISPFEGCQH
jgi:hypothetical protein